VTTNGWQPLGYLLVSAPILKNLAQMINFMKMLNSKLIIQIPLKGNMKLFEIRYEFTYTTKLFRKMKQHLQSSESDKDIVEEK
jgi:hypothetical protein